MMKLYLVLALTLVASAAAQEAPAQGGEAAPEPYSYGYSTDTHAAQEQREPNGRVTGSYMLVGEDGRERRVEYVADEAGYRAKVTTNEVGTKSESPADVQLIASEPTAAQLAYQPAPQVQYQQAAQQVQYQPIQRFGVAPSVVSTVTQQQQQQPASYRQVSYASRSTVPQAGYGYGYGYYPGYGYGQVQNGGYYGYGNGIQNGYYGYTGGYYPAGYTVGNLGYSGASSSSSSSKLVNVGNYNNHLPSQYYKSIGVANGVVNPAQQVGYSQSGYRYVSQPAGVTTSSVRTVSSGPVPSSYSVQPVGNSNLVGSSNYIVLQKRSATETAKPVAESKVTASAPVAESKAEVQKAKST